MDSDGTQCEKVFLGCFPWRRFLVVKSLFPPDWPTHVWLSDCDARDWLTDQWGDWPAGEGTDWLIDQWGSLLTYQRDDLLVCVVTELTDRSERRLTDQWVTYLVSVDTSVSSMYVSDSPSIIDREVAYLASCLTERSYQRAGPHLQSEAINQERLITS